MTSASDVNKPLLVGQILAGLDAELLRSTQAAREAAAGATDEQNRAENKYDTRGLEASYLAHGQSRQARETVLAREQIAAWAVRDFGPDEPVGVGALVELESAGERSWYFLAPAAGGTELVHAGREVLVITPPSPLGRLLLGKRRGEHVETGTGTARRTQRVTTVA